MERYGRKYGDEKLYKESRELLMSGFSWPPRSYTCTFCKREFRSAQALGGHMNVHRRDRARLRHHSPPLLFNPSPNPSSSSSSNNTLPNLNFSPPSPPPPSPLSTFPCSTAPLTHAFPAILSSLNGHLAAPSPSFSSATFQLRRYEEMKRARAVDAFFRVEGLKDFMEEEQEEEDRGRETVKIDLEIGMREDLDLELRL